MRPDTVAEALDHLATPGVARPLGGGQSLINALKLRLVDVDLLVDVTRIDSMKEIRRGDDGKLAIGASVTYREAAGSELVRRHAPRLAAVCDGLVDRQVRSRGTVGGNCCFADPTNNLPPLLVALDADFVIASPAGSRTVAADDFFLGQQQTAVGPGELLLEIKVPEHADRMVGYASLRLGEDSWALARCATSLKIDGHVVDARVVVSCASPAPARQRRLEDRLVGAAPTGDAIDDALSAFGDGLMPVSDVHAGAEYRLAMARVMTERALKEALGGERSQDG